MRALLLFLGFLASGLLIASPEEPPFKAGEELLTRRWPGAAAERVEVVRITSWARATYRSGI